MPKNLLIVESPAKAKTIEKYLGKDFKVLSSVGHIRTDKKVDTEHDFKVDYEIDPGHTKIVNDLKKAIGAGTKVWLATDEDREGESISWHLLEVLKLPKNTHRITFHEITEPALKDAIAHPRTVDMDMVSSQQARQTLDMLVGYDLSGVVRKKVPGAVSAGRVQSPALRLVVEKEREIEAFEGKFSYKINGFFSEKGLKLSKTALKDTEKLPRGVFKAELSDTAPESEKTATELLEKLKGAEFVVSGIEEKDGKKNGPVPFTTAALQIEANARLGFSASTTMRAAQGLYQAGHITYHRTDSLNLSNQALGAIARFIENKYGKNYLQVRNFKTKALGAQEAHEAIRPTHIETEEAGANDYEKRLYRLIRSRTLATQMAAATVKRTNVSITPVVAGKKVVSGGKELVFVAKGETVIFDGFLKVYGSSKDVILPALKAGDELSMYDIVARQNFAKAPARYTEGSLVKKLEELGIGRPSTYASIMSAIQARGYVVKGESEGEEREVTEIVLHGSPSLRDGDAAKFSISTETASEKTGATRGKLVPTPVGELVADFLGQNFENIVDYEFTAGVEEKLDKIAEAKLTRVKMLSDFYTPFSKQVLKSDKVERFNSARELGVDPVSKKKVYAKIGKNGGFIQLGETEKESGEKPRFVPLPDGETVKTVSLTQALEQLKMPELPRSLGTAPDGTEIIAAAGPFGPYLKAGEYNISLSKTDEAQDPYTITLETAVFLYQKKKDSIIADWGEIKIIVGPYGPYIKGPGIKVPGSRRPKPNNAKVPKDMDPKKITLEQAKEMLENKPKSSRHKAHHKRKK